MNEEIMNNEVIEGENDYAPAKVTVDDSTGSGSGIIAAVVVGAVAVAGGVGAYLYKTRAKREAKRIEKLRKKGYTIVEPGENVIIDYVDVESEDVTETTEEQAEE